MPRYNVQKRRRLDNITEKHNRNMRKVLKTDLNQRAHQLFEDLNDGERFFRGDVKKIRKKTDKVLEIHEFESVRAGLSDGIQEVTPENKLGLWKLLPENSCPIQTLDQFWPKLAKKRDTLTAKAIKKIRKRRKFTIPGLRNLVLDSYLTNLRAGFRDVASDWIEGENTIDDVLKMLSGVFQRTDNQAKAIFRTETTNYFNETRADYFIEETSMDFMQIFTLADGRRSKICETRHGWVFPIAESRQKRKSPAFHVHCRTIQRPLTSRLASHRALIDIGLAMNESNFEPLPKNWV